MRIPTARKKPAQKQIAFLAFERGDFDKVIRALAKVPKNERQDVDTLKLLGLAHFNQGRSEYALQLLFQALKKESADASLYLYIATVVGNDLCTSNRPCLEKFLRVLLKNLEWVGDQRGLVCGILSALKFDEPGIDEAKELVYESFALPFLKNAIASTYVDMALELETQIYLKYVYQKEEQEHFVDTVTEWSVEMEQMGRAVAADTTPSNPSSMRDSDRPLVAFFIHNESLLAHIVNVLTLVGSYRKLATQPYEVKLYSFNGHSPEMRQRCRAMGIEVYGVCDDYPQYDNYQRLCRIREQLLYDGVDVLFWVCLGAMMPFAFGMGMAPKQVWWSMKYKGIVLDSIDAYMHAVIHEFSPEVEGSRWHPIKLGNYDFVGDYASNRERASAIRQRFSQHGTLLGAFARVEKLSDDRYLGAVARILKDNPECAYLWSGRTHDPSIRDFFHSHGLAERNHYVGWVDTQVYAQVIDIFLDSFPFFCGHTLFEAMAVGKASITIAGEISDMSETAPHRQVHDIYHGLVGDKEDRERVSRVVYDGEMPFISWDIDGYVEKANLLIRDASVRSDCGEINRRVIGEFLSDPIRMGESFVNRVKELLA